MIKPAVQPNPAQQTQAVAVLVLCPRGGAVSAHPSTGGTTRGFLGGLGSLEDRRVLCDECKLQAKIGGTQARSWPVPSAVRKFRPSEAEDLTEPEADVLASLTGEQFSATKVHRNRDHKNHQAVKAWRDPRMRTSLCDRPVAETSSSEDRV